MNKKGSGWIWFLIIILIVAAIGIYFWTTGDTTPATGITPSASIVPQPPAFP